MPTSWYRSRIRMKKHVTLFRQQYALECKTHAGTRNRYARKKTLSIRYTPVPGTSFQGEKCDSSITIWIANIQTKTFVYLETNVKVNFTLKQAMKAQMGSSGIALLFL